MPPCVDEYKSIKATLEGKGFPDAIGNAKELENMNRVLGKALMKRAIGMVPVIQSMQKESQSMYRLHSRNMVSTTQWRSFQLAELTVSNEVNEVREEADEIEEGWSQLIWRQASQYHAMLKQRQMQEEQNKQAKEGQGGNASLPANQEPKRKPAAPLTEEQKRIAADKVARELMKEEERKDKGGKKFQGVKKGFLDNKNK